MTMPNNWFKTLLNLLGHGSSRAREFHPHPLTEPCVKVSPHTALHTLCFVHMLLSSYPPLCLRVVYLHCSSLSAFPLAFRLLPPTFHQRACITVLPHLCRMPQCHRQVIALLVARTVRHWLLTWLESRLTTPHRMGHFMHLFSPWQNTSKLALPIWLNENVHLRSAQ